MKVKSLSRVGLCATPWVVTYQAPPSMGFSRQQRWSGVPLPSGGYLGGNNFSEKLILGISFKEMILFFCFCFILFCFCLPLFSKITPKMPEQYVRHYLFPCCRTEQKVTAFGRCFLGRDYLLQRLVTHSLSKCLCNACSEAGPILGTQEGVKQTVRVLEHFP